MMRQKNTNGMLIWTLTMVLVSTLFIGCGAFPTAMATFTPTPTADADATMIASLPTLPPEAPTLPPPVAMAGWHIIFQQQGSAKADITTQKVLGDITVSQNFMLEVACVGSGNVQAHIGPWGNVSGLCPRDPGFAADTEVPPASFTLYPVTIKIQGPVQWAVVVQEKD